MSGFDQVAWLPLCAGLTLVGLVGSWLAGRRRGAAAGLRGAAWSLLPLAAYLTGILPLLWRIGTAVAGWVADLVFSPRVWAGVALTGLAVALYMTARVLRRGAATRATGGRPIEAPQRRAAPARREDPGEFAEVEEILRRRGIR